MSTAMVLAAGKQSILDGLSPLQLFFASLALLLVAGAIYFVNKTKFEGQSTVAEIAAFLCALAGILGLYQSLFGG